MADTKATILIVDDDPDFRFIHKTKLETDGYAVVEADGVDTAMATLGDAKPDIAVIDLMMREVDDGFTLCHRLKRNNPKMPVIMVTSVHTETGMDFDASTQEERAWIKADVLLSKPIRLEQLKAEIDRLLGK